MTLSSELVTLGQYLAGEFDNQKQANADPVWYVHLRLWLRSVLLFSEDSITLFAEQASVVNSARPYRQRIMRLQHHRVRPDSLQVQYYMFKDPGKYIGSGRVPELLDRLTLEEIELLPGCVLDVNVERLEANRYHFKAFPTTDKPCSFTYQGNTYQVSLGFEVNFEELQTYDKGIDPQTGKAIWGALLGPFRFQKLQQFSIQ